MFDQLRSTNLLIPGPMIDPDGAFFPSEPAHQQLVKPFNHGRPPLNVGNTPVGICIDILYSYTYRGIIFVPRDVFFHRGLRTNSSKCPYCTRFLYDCGTHCTCPNLNDRRGP